MKDDRVETVTLPFEETSGDITIKIPEDPRWKRLEEAIEKLKKSVEHITSEIEETKKLNKKLKEIGVLFEG